MSDGQGEGRRGGKKTGGSGGAKRGKRKRGGIDWFVLKDKEGGNYNDAEL